MLTVVFVGFAMSWTQVQLCYNRFKEGREDVIVDAPSVLPSTSTTDKNIEAVDSLLMRLLMMLAYRSAYSKQFLRVF